MKVGDKVKCIEESTNGFPGELGKIYTVELFQKGVIYLKGFPLVEGFGCRVKRFELVKKKEKNLPEWF